jgi:hypothetical protein
MFSGYGMQGAGKSKTEATGGSGDQVIFHAKAESANSA